MRAKINQGLLYKQFAESGKTQKSKSWIKTPQMEFDIIRELLKRLKETLK